MTKGIYHRQQFVTRIAPLLSMKTVNAVLNVNNTGMSYKLIMMFDGIL